jgi:hypothetical protein
MGNVANAGQGIANLSGLGEGTAAEAAARLGNEATLKNTLLPIAAGGMGLASIEEQRKYEKEMAAGNNAATLDFNTQMATIEANRKRAEDSVRRNPYQYAGGGAIAFAPGGSVPGFLSGGGDGLSDDIPATIEGKQPARLADGEFVVSADVVSGLGGGSSKAGAKKLYAMMDRVRQQAHGTNKQVRKVSNKALPA